MAYFPNGSSGMAFEEECQRCVFGEFACPIARVQTEYNYDSVNNTVATKILNDLVRNDGKCIMFRRFIEKLKL